MAEDPPDDDGYVTLDLKHCREPIRSLRVLRLTRTQVSFTSPLPRGGRALVCPLCERIISAELSGLL